MIAFRWVLRKFDVLFMTKWQRSKEMFAFLYAKCKYILKIYLHEREIRYLLLCLCEIIYLSTGERIPLAGFYAVEPHC